MEGKRNKYGSCHDSCQIDLERQKLIQTEKNGCSMSPQTTTSQHSPVPLSVNLAMILSGLWRPSTGGRTCDSCGRDDDIDNKTEVSIEMENIPALDSQGHSSDEEKTNFLIDVDFIGEAELMDLNPFHRKVSVNPWIEIPFITVLLFNFGCWTKCYITLLCLNLKEKEVLLDTLDYLSFTVPISSAVAFPLYVRISACLKRFNNRKISILEIVDLQRVKECTTVLMESAIGHQSVRFQKFMPFFALSFANTILKIVSEVFINPPMCQKALHNFFRIQAALCFMSYGGFWYIIYINRMALHCELNEAILRIGQAAIRNEIDQARRLINRLYSKYHVLRKFTGVWMAAMMFATTIHVALSVMYTDIELSHLVEADSNSGWMAFGSLSDLTITWLQIAMFYALPLKALGGINIEYLWNRFRHVITKSKVEAHSSYFDEVLHYVKEIDTLGSPLLRWTAAFPVLALLFPLLLNINFPDGLSWRYRYPYHQCSNDTYVTVTEGVFQF